MAELFAGRHTQLFKIVDTIAERGRHVVLYGERGVGKSSLSQIIPFFIPSGPQKIRHIRVQAFPGDTFSSVAKRIFSDIRFEADYGEGQKAYTVSEFYPGEVDIDMFLREMRVFKENEIPILVIDEFNEIDDEDTSITIANIMKALSDIGSIVTLIIVGVADNISDLIERHQSIERCTEQILMPRMTVEERTEVLDKRLRQLGMTISGDAKWKIVNLSKGLPAYVHSLGKHAVFSALGARRTHVTEDDVDNGIDAILQSSQQTIKDGYEAATRSNQAKAQFRHVLTACALAKVDDNGYFTPTAVRDPLIGILGKNVDLGHFQDTLKEFTHKRGAVLEVSGEPRSYRYRFASPAMQPYVIMKGIKEGIVGKDAKQALSSPEQPELFPTV